MLECKVVQAIQVVEKIQRCIAEAASCRFSFLSVQWDCSVLLVWEYSRYHFSLFSRKRAASHQKACEHSSTSGPGCCSELEYVVFGCGRRVALRVAFFKVAVTASASFVAWRFGSQQKSYVLPRGRLHLPNVLCVGRSHSFNVFKVAVEWPATQHVHSVCSRACHPYTDEW